MTAMPRTRNLPELLTALYAMAFGFFVYSDNGMRVDEIIHYDQISSLAGASRALHPGLTMIPGYHVIVAALAWPIGGASEFNVRLITFLLSLATAGVFLLLARAWHPERAGTLLLQFTFLPILFPQFFLVYTDVPAMLFVLLMVLAADRRRYALAGMFGFLSCLIRQNDIIWVAFVMVWSYLRDRGWQWTPVAEMLRSYWTFVATGIAFVAFVTANGGQVALGDATAHPLGAFNLTNIFFLLFLTFFLFLPLWWGYRGAIAARARNGRSWLALAVLGVVFWLGFANSHPYNQSGGDFYLRNALLIFFTSTATLKLVFFVPVALAALFLSAVPLTRAGWVLYPFTLLALVPEGLVEQRYFLIPLALFLLVREPTARTSERAQVALSFAGALSLLIVVERGWRWM